VRVEVLGCDGGPAPGRLPTTFLLDGRVLVDAGSAASGLEPDRRGDVTDVIVTHPHLDHIRDLAFLAPARDVETHGRLKIWGVSSCIHAIRTCVFSHLVWFDFSQDSPDEGAKVEFHIMQPDEVYRIASLDVRAVPVAHSKDGVGFIVQAKERCIVFTGDTGPTALLWERALESGPIDGVFTDVSYPSRMTPQAIAQGHGTPRLLCRELTKLRGLAPRVFACHLKPEFYDETKKELAEDMPSIEVPVAGDIIELG